MSKKKLSNDFHPEAKDARYILAHMLQSYHEAMEAAPQDLRTKIAMAVEDALLPATNVGLCIEFMDYHLSKKYLDILKKYNKGHGIL